MSTSKISLAEATDLLQTWYGISGNLKTLPGEVDANFKVSTQKGDFLLKISPAETDSRFLEFQQEILQHLQQISVERESLQIHSAKKKDEHFLEFPVIFQNKNNENFTEVIQQNGSVIYLRLLSWMPGNLWSDLHYHNNQLLFSLGKAAGYLTKQLENFNSPYAKRDYDWDISKAEWAKQHQDIFTGQKRHFIELFYGGFETVLPRLINSRHSVVHADVNDNNIVVNALGEKSGVKSIIDFGDAIYTATINDLAVTITYAVMNKTAPLEAAVPIIEGYHTQFALKEDELEMLYWLVGARLVISLTKSALNRKRAPENEYLTISEKPAWRLIEQWAQISRDVATAFFRKACGYEAHPKSSGFKAFARANSVHLNSIFKNEALVENLDLDINASTIPTLQTYREPLALKNEIRKIWTAKGEPLPAGGYAEVRPDFIKESFRVETNRGSFWKSSLLGTQIWLFKDTPVYTPFSGRIVQLDDNSIIIEHEMSVKEAQQPFKAENSEEKSDTVEKPDVFYLVYSNLKPSENLQLHEGVKKGILIGNYSEKSLQPLHLQIMLNNPATTKPQFSCIYEEAAVYEEIFPAPHLLFTGLLQKNKKEDLSSKIEFRKKHLGKSLSLSYQQPLKIVRGDGLFLLDHTGRKYMDLVNNVAHVGHEHPEVVKAGQTQMAMLNTNSRYLHDNILDFAKELLKTFPEELSVVHFVNSGSEANELAIRMAKNYTGERDFITIEVGYHGNTNACIDISSYKFDGKGGKGAPPFTHVVPLPDTLRGKYKGRGQGLQYAQHVQEYIQNLEKLGRKPAAFIAESIISCAGQIELPENFLTAAYKYTREAGGLCIADEVQVGCGRMGKTFWGFELHGVVPDIVTIGKPLGNGHPLAAVVCTQKVAESFANGMEYFNTFGGNPVSCAIGKQVLKTIKEEKLQENALHTGEYLKQSLRQLATKFPVIADVRGQGLFLGFELLDSKGKPLAAQANYLVQRMKECGYLMSTEGPDDNILKIKPPMVFDKADARQFMEVMTEVFKDDFFNQ